MATIDCADLDLTGCTILVVEDDFMVGFNLCSELTALGADEVPLCPSVATALRCIADEERIDVAIVDVNLDGVLSLPVVDALIARRIPTILCTGYDAWNFDERYAGLPHCEKPFTRTAFLRELARALPQATLRTPVAH